MAITGGTPQRRTTGGMVAAIAAKSLATGVLSLYAPSNKQNKHMELVDDSRDDESLGGADHDWAGHCPIETPRDTTTAVAVAVATNNKNNPINEEEDVHYFWEAKSDLSDNDDDDDSDSDDDDDVHYFWATAASSDVALDIISQTNYTNNHAYGHTCKYCKGASFDSESTMLAHQAICAFSYDQQGLMQDGDKLTYFLSNEYEDEEIDPTTFTSDQNSIGNNNTTFAIQLMPETYCASTDESIVGLQMIKDSDPSSNSILAIKHATDKYFQDGASSMDKTDPFFQYSADTDDLLASSSSGETTDASEEEEGSLMLSFFRMEPPTEDTAYDDMPLLVRVVGGGNHKEGGHSTYKNRKNIRIRLSQILRMKLVKFPQMKKKREFVRVSRPRTKTCMDAFLQVRTPWRPVTLGSSMTRNTQSIGDPKLEQFDVLEEFYTESIGSEE